MKKKKTLLARPGHLTICRHNISTPPASCGAVGTTVGTLSNLEHPSNGETTSVVRRHIHSIEQEKKAQRAVKQRQESWPQQTNQVLIQSDTVKDNFLTVSSVRQFRNTPPPPPSPPAPRPPACPPARPPRNIGVSLRPCIVQWGPLHRTMRIRGQRPTTTTRVVVGIHTHTHTHPLPPPPPTTSTNDNFAKVMTYKNSKTGQCRHTHTARLLCYNVIIPFSPPPGLCLPARAVQLILRLAV